MEINTIGFTRKSAESFFNLVRSAKVKTLIDVRLNNVSQLSGFAKKDDLRFFLKELCGAEYVHMPELAPTKIMLSSYKNGDMSWDDYESSFLDLLSKRHIERSIDHGVLADGCLLCSEHEPHLCHRRLVVEYLKSTTDLNLKVRHLM